MTMTWKSAVAALAIAGAACNQPSTVENAPLGSDVQLTRQNGALVEGKLTARDERTVKVDVGKVTRSVPKADIADLRVVDAAAKMPDPPPAAKFREYTVPEGTKLALELITPVNSDTSRVEDAVEATLESPVLVDGVEVLPAGARAVGAVSSVVPAGKVKGRASLALRFTDLRVREESYPIQARFGMTAPATKKDDAMKIGIPAAGGAIIGAIIGGKKGAAVGATIGAGGGTAAVLMTPGKEIELPSGTTISVALDGPIEVRVPVRAAKPTS
ncbi:MAG: hypothetical protein ACRD2N_16245 [Vicinamibacterales bacterium]